jgi:hypothetical protein
MGRYDATSPFTARAYAPLEKAAALPKASILPEQALIFMNARMGLPVKDTWWTSIRAKLTARPASIQDESSLGALSTCLRTADCNFPAASLMDAFLAALSHADATPRLKAMYADFAWNSLEDRTLALAVQREVVKAAPSEPAYRIGLARMCIALGDTPCIREQLQWIKAANVGGWLDGDIATIESQLATPRSS